MSRKRVVFVDDEQAILDALEDRMFSDRKRWDLHFANSGAAALALMREQPADLVISDMRMPGMDGAQLLDQVQTLYPGTARVVLTGHAEREAIFRVLPVSHQFLAKPCDTGALRSAIERTLGLQEMIASSAIRRVVTSFAALPSVPRLYAQLLAVAADPNSSVEDFAAVVTSDPAMSAKVLQLSNSAYFGRRQPVISLTEAVGYLGIELIKGLALAGEMFTAYRGSAAPGFSFEAAHRFALQSARVARKLIPERKQAEEAFTSALVHDLGTVILARQMPDEYGAILSAVQAGEGSLWELEEQRLGTTHAEIGAYLLGVWGLPFSIVESVAHHHHPGRVTTGDRQVLAAVHAADAMVAAQFAKHSDISAALDRAFLRDAGLEDRISKWMSIAQNEAEEVGAAA